MKQNIVFLLIIFSMLSLQASGHRQDLFDDDIDMLPLLIEAQDAVRDMGKFFLGFLLGPQHVNHHHRQQIEYHPLSSAFLIEECCQQPQPVKTENDAPIVTQKRHVMSNKISLKTCMACRVLVARFDAKVKDRKAQDVGYGLVKKSVKISQVQKSQTLEEHTIVASSTISKQELQAAQIYLHNNKKLQKLAKRGKKKVEHDIIAGKKIVKNAFVFLRQDIEND